VELLALLRHRAGGAAAGGADPGHLRARPDVDPQADRSPEAAPAVEETLVEESLVEEVSIDGMCGVY